MSKIWTTRLLIWSLALINGLARAQAGQAQRDAAQFHQLIEKTWNSGNRQQLDEYLHFIPTKQLERAMQASDMKTAMDEAKGISVADLAAAKLGALVPTRTDLDIDSLLAKGSKSMPLTIVMVPGIFGEFIPTRAMEEVFAATPEVQQMWEDRVKAAAATRPELTTDETFLLKDGIITRPLHEVVNVGAIKSSAGDELVRVIIFRTPLGSLETLGDLSVRAGQFNRRLEKYLALTGPQKLLFVGYSRGTIIGLDMLAQAKKAGKPWLNQTVGMVSLGGVTFGSVLADNTKAEGSPMAEAIARVKKLKDALVPCSFWNISTRAANYKEWGSFAIDMAKISKKMRTGQIRPQEKDLINSPISLQLDPKGIWEILTTLESQYNLFGVAYWADYEANVKKFKEMVEEILLAVDELRSERRLDWWKNNEVPNHITYYAITGAMANAEASEYEKQAFDTLVGYSKKSYDDLMLLQNFIDYKSTSGLSLNDSQVSVVQAAFLPNVIAELNPQNAGLKTKFLGTLGTHHWGLALRIVNKMRDGRMNPVPRAAILKALAAQAVLDMNP